MEVENKMRICKVFIFLWFSFSLSHCFSQEKNWSLEVNYPIPVDNNFVGQNFLGIFDVGAKYRFLDTEILNFGAGLNAGIMKFQNEEEFEHYLLFNYYLQPKIFTELDIENLPEFRPFVYAGYSFMIFRADGTNYTNDLYYTSETLNGYNFGLGLVYNLSDKFFIQMQYDFTRLKGENRNSASPYNVRVSLLKAGVGMRL